MTWQNWSQEKSGPLDLGHYEAIGGMAEALSRHADEAFSELDDDQQIAFTRNFGEIRGRRRADTLDHR